MYHMTPKNHQDSPRQSIDYYKQAQKFLFENQVPPTPINYTVAYEYAAERHPNLNQEIDMQVERGGTIDSYYLANLFERHFFDNGVEKFESHVTDINQIIFQTLKSMGSASTDFDEYGQLLEKQIYQLNQNAEFNSFGVIAATLLDATKQTQQVSNKLNEQLMESNQEINALHHELEEARRDAYTDALTGLYNRKALNNKLDHLLELQIDRITPLSILMLDIDHFKQFNDTYGHLIGDEVICRVAETLKRHSSENNIAARFGGEEFILVMPNTDIDEAIDLAKSINESVAQINLIRRRSRERLPGITISVGAASMQEGEERDDLLERADLALYQAKRSGRNRVISDLQCLSMQQKV